MRPILFSRFSVIAANQVTDLAVRWQHFEYTAVTSPSMRHLLRLGNAMILSLSWSDYRRSLDWRLDILIIYNTWLRVSTTVLRIFAFYKLLYSNLHDILYVFTSRWLVMVPNRVDSSASALALFLADDCLNTNPWRQLSTILTPVAYPYIALSRIIYKTPLQQLCAMASHIFALETCLLSLWNVITLPLPGNGWLLLLKLYCHHFIINTRCQMYIVTNCYLLCHQYHEGLKSAGF
jgi:hypothetical protein